MLCRQISPAAPHRNRPVGRVSQLPPGGESGQPHRRRGPERHTGSADGPPLDPGRGLQRRPCFPALQEAHRSRHDRRGEGRADPAVHQPGQRLVVVRAEARRLVGTQKMALNLMPPPNSFSDKLVSRQYLRLIRMRLPTITPNRARRHSRLCLVGCHSVETLL